MERRSQSSVAARYKLLQDLVVIVSTSVSQYRAGRDARHGQVNLLACAASSASSEPSNAAVPALSIAAALDALSVATASVAAAQHVDMRSSLQK